MLLEFPSHLGICPFAEDRQRNAADYHAYVYTDVSHRDKSDSYISLELVKSQHSDQRTTAILLGSRMSLVDVYRPSIN